MPLLPGSLNLTWEWNALVISSGNWVHILWFSLDVIIYVFNIRYLNTVGKRLLYFLWSALLLFGFWWLFRSEIKDAVLISSFIMDLVMAISFLIRAKKISRDGKIAIAIFKLLGDVAACFAYTSYTEWIPLIGCIVFICNLLYLCYCIEERSGSKPKKRKRKKRV